MYSARTIIKVGLFTTAIVLASVALLPAISSAQGRGNGKPEDVAARVAERKANAQTKIEEKRAEVDTKTQEQRKTVCEKKQAQAESAMNRVSAQATRLLGVMDKFYVRVQGFYDSGQLTDPDYDTLNDAVMSAQEAAVLEIAALAELDIDLDCDNPEVAVGVNAFKTSAGASKEALRSYRSALVDLISSLRAEAAEKDSADDSSDDSTETETESDTETETETNTVTEEN